MSEQSSDRLINSEVKERLKDQFQSISGMDTKAGIVLGFTAALLAALLNSDWFNSLPFYLLFPILLQVCLVMIYGVKAYRAKGYRKDPEPSPLIENYQGKFENKVLGQLIKNYEASYNDNKKAIKAKAEDLNTSFVLLAMTVCTICFYFLLTSAIGDKSTIKMFSVSQGVIHHGR